ncbi:FAD-dependent oxidoreductase, partial [bacterium]|nr:FAD-dependent oxidoreductase [bacterium]
YLIDKKGSAPCKSTCPAHVSIQGFIALINQGKQKEALKLFKDQHPFPGSCGRVCHHPCEKICSRGDADEPMAIQYLHRFLSDQDMVSDTPYIPVIEDKKDEKVAIVGAGPAGLSCAYFLARKGYDVTLFEKLPVKGGMMAVGIPDYRLPRSVLDAEIKTIERLGVSVKTGVNFGTDITLKSLEEEGYKSLFLATGLHLSRKLGVKGEDLKGVLPGVAFLRDVALGKKMEFGEHVVVIGGGNVAIDVALSVKRLGAKRVTLVCLEKREEMPAWDYEIEEALEEGIAIMNSLGPKELTGKNGTFQAIEFKKCVSVFNENGAFSPSYDEKERTILEADQTIVAIGQMADLSFAENQKIPVTRRGGLDVDPVTLQSSIPWVFGGGDVVYGPKSVVEAVESGKTAAESIHRFIVGDDLYEDRPKEWKYEKPELENIEPARRVSINKISVEERIGNFNEISFGFSESDVKKEAARCLECAVCSECYQCVDVCQPKAIDHEMQPQEIKVDVGSIIVATGFDLMDPTPIKQFGYGKFQNVFTSFEFERLSNATGPTGGKIRIRDENGELTKIPKSVAILHCVGSRDANYHKYCSRVCCMYGLKYSHLIKEKVGHDTEIYDFYIDQRCFGKGYEEFYQRCQNEGTHFIRGKVAEITDQAETYNEEGKLIAIAEDTLLGENVRIPVDMVILCVAMEARPDAGHVSRVFGLNQGADGFFLEEHPKLAPLNTPTDGIFLAGACQSPKDIPDTVAQASGAAVKALALSTRGIVTVPPTISYIDPNMCAGCQTCIGLCVYTAIEFDARRGVSVVNEALCKGCGSCSGFCPSNAASIRHFHPIQIFAELDGIRGSIHKVGL